MRGRLALLAAVLAATAMVATAALSGQGASGASALMRVEPRSASISRGDQVAVDIVVENVTNLGAYQFELNFDPVPLAYVHVADGGFLGRTGRGVSCRAPILDEGAVRFGCASAGSLSNIPGPTGAGILATVTLVARCPGHSALTLAQVELSDPLVHEVYVVETHGSAVTVTGQGPCASPTPSSGGGGDGGNDGGNDTNNPRATATPRSGSGVQSGQDGGSGGAAGAAGGGASPEDGSTALVAPGTSGGDPGGLGGITGGTVAGGGSAQGGASGSQSGAFDGSGAGSERFPIAGTGPPPDHDADWPSLLAAGLAGLGAMLLASGARRSGRVRTAGRPSDEARS